MLQFSMMSNMFILQTFKKMSKFSAVMFFLQMFHKMSKFSEVMPILMPKIKQFSLATMHRPNQAAIQSLEIPTIELKAQRYLVMPSLQDRVAQWLLSDDKEMDASPTRPKPNSQKMQMAWRRMVLHSIRIYVDILMQSAADYLVSRNQGTIVTSVPQAAKQSKKDAQTETKVLRGIGRPLPRSTASKEWQFEPSACMHSKDLLCQRGSKNNFWWTCLGCGSRCQRLEWEIDQQENSKGRVGLGHCHV
jgi:hypothetical protein